jgi:hypothetical protein
VRARGVVLAHHGDEQEVAARGTRAGHAAPCLAGGRRQRGFAKSPLAFGDFQEKIKTGQNQPYFAILQTRNFQKLVPTLCGIIDHFKNNTQQDFEGLKHFK